jgi:hypothetical protein
MSPSIAWLSTAVMRPLRTTLTPLARWLSLVTGSRWWRNWLGPALAGGWFAGAAFLALRRHATFHTHLFDLGYYTQVLWYTSQGHWFFNTVRSGNFLRDHFSPALAVLAPLMWVAPDARPLLVVQIAVLAATILPAYAILHDRHPRLAPGLVAAYCLNFLVHRTALVEFHEIMLAALPLSVSAWALFRRRRWLVVASGVAALLVREDMGVYVAVLGLYAALVQPGSRWFGLTLVLLGAGWTALMPTVVLPALGLGVLYHPSLCACARQRGCRAGQPGLRGRAYAHRRADLAQAARGGAVAGGGGRCATVGRQRTVIVGGAPPVPHGAAGHRSGWSA